MTTIELEDALRAEEVLARELAEYPGRWVAIQDHAIVADAESIEELLQSVDPGELDRIIEVSREPVEACLY
jgi:hypothetical protein